MEHTKEPWEAFPSEDCHAIAWVGKIGIFQADGMPHREWANPEIDARRIVACVNACAGIPTDVLEVTPSLENLWTDTLQHRDNLIAALENCRLLAARNRKEEWAQHILRFCESAGTTGSPLRAIAETTAQPAQPTPPDTGE